MSLQSSDHARLVAASPTWCAIPAARGEKIVRSVPRSRCSLSCAPSRLSRIWSSLILSALFAGPEPRLSNAAICALRQASNSLGAVV